MKKVTEIEFVDSLVKINRKSLRENRKRLSKTEEYFMRDRLRGDYKVFAELDGE